MNYMKFSACFAESRSFGANVGEAAVLAAPHALFGGLEHGVFFDGLGKGEEAAFVFHFGNGDIAHHSGDDGEAFGVGDIGIGGVHVGMFFELTVGGSLQVVESGTDHAGGEAGGDFHIATFKELEQALGVFLFLAGDFFESLGHFHIAVLLSLRSEEGVAVAGLGFAGKGLPQVLFGFGTGIGIFLFHSKNLHYVLDFGSIIPPNIAVVKGKC